MTAERVRLEPLTPDDSQTLWQWINARDLVVQSSQYRPVHTDSHEHWFKRIQNTPDCVIFALRIFPSQTLIGSCQLHSIHPVHRSADLQIRIGADNCRNKGYGKQALDQLLEFGFRDLNLNRIYLHVLADNLPAQRLYERFHFQHEGRLRCAVFVDGRYQDVLLMGLLREEYMTSKQESGSAMHKESA